MFRFSARSTSGRRRSRRPAWRYPIAALAAAVLASFVAPSACAQPAAVESRERPNIVLILTDDQGYGDLSCHGNRMLHTPALDALWAESVRLTNFHVDPTCSPTRAALLTGRYSSRTGVWHTVMGRSLLRSDETTLAELLRRAGYRTAIFGKWHLGDNAPSRPEDFGFEETLIHGGGGVGQTPDYWGNDYFDDTYRHNGVWKKFDGYCTDVWFEQAMRFLEDNRERPCFAYIPTNAAHGPFRVAERYSRPFRDAGIPSPRAEFYGMIVNIDENVARLRAKLAELGMADNTIIIFATDNGTAAGMRDSGGFNAGMRGTKGSEYDGGHRVPCFLHWPAGGLVGGRDIPQLTAHIDLLPTLLDMAGVPKPAELQLDGTSLTPLLFDRGEWLQRTLFVHSQRIDHPEKWRQSAVMTDRWRLINGRELYDVQADPSQSTDVAVQHAGVVRKLRAAYELWYADVSAGFSEYTRIELGSRHAPALTLTCHDWHAPLAQIPWTHEMIERDPRANGFWAVDVVRDGQYEITLRARPPHVPHRLPAGTARLTIGDVDVSRDVDEGAAAATFRVDLPKGPVFLQTWLDQADGSSHGAFYVEVRSLP